MTDLNQGASIESERERVGRENAEFTEWWNRVQACPEHSLITENAAHAAWQERARRTPAATTGELPPLPAPEMESWDGTYGYTVEQYREGQRAAIEADRAQRQAAPASAQPADKIASYPLEELGCKDAPDSRRLFRVNDWQLTVGDVRAARAAGAQPDQRDSAAVPACRNQGGICACRSGGSFGGCAMERAASPAAQPAKDEQWSKQPPTEQGEYWHWNGEEDTAPYIYHILWSGTAKKCFVSIGQYGIEEASFCDEFGGWWKKIPQPAIPQGQDSANNGADEQKGGAIGDGGKNG